AKKGMNELSLTRLEVELTWNLGHPLYGGHSSLQRESAHLVPLLQPFSLGHLSFCLLQLPSAGHLFGRSPGHRGSAGHFFSPFLHSPLKHWTEFFAHAFVIQSRGVEAKNPPLHW